MISAWSITILVQELLFYIIVYLIKMKKSIVHSNILSLNLTRKFSFTTYSFKFVRNILSKDTWYMKYLTIVYFLQDKKYLTTIFTKLLVIRVFIY